MESLDTKRKYFRGLFSDALSNSDKFTCFTSASKRLSAKDLPAVKVLTPQCQEEFLGAPPPFYACVLTLIVSITAGDNEEAENTLDDLACEAHILITNSLAEKDISQPRRVKSETEFKEGGSEIIGNINIWYEVSYTLKEFIPGKKLKKYKGINAIFGGTD